MVVFILMVGFIFGAILQYASLNKYNVISGLAILENFAVAKAIALAIGVGSILLTLEIGMGFASYHIKPLLLGGIVLGGLLFGAGMAILGYCPGTLAISLGQGSIDALIGILGGLLGGLIFTLFQPSLTGLLGPDLGSISLQSLSGANAVFYLLSFILSGLFIGVSFWLHKKDQTKDYKWLYAGIALAFLNAILFLTATFNKPIGASTAFPYAADLLTGTTENSYFEKIKNSGNWQVIFLTGALLAGFIISVVKKEFKWVLIHSNWERFKGSSKTKRILWSFIGGFVLIFGARMAGGCTSGHILSGGMQLAASSMLFAVFTFAGLLITGKLFYHKKADQ